MSLDQKISFVGMMGCGKTTIGRELAKKLNIEFIDSDSVIEQETSLSITNIFAMLGEEEFRKIEERVINNLLKQDNDFILATGGGAFVNQNIRKNLLSKSLVFWLDSDPKTILSRVRKNNNRPLLEVEDPQKKITALLKERIKYYKQAHFSINTDNTNLKITLDQILKKINN